MDRFKPHFLLQNAYAQTIASFYWPQLPLTAEGVEHIIDLPDGDKVILVENRPVGIKKKRIILLLHGLSGSSQSNYMRRLAYYFTEQGHRVFRMNLRGSGQGLFLARKTYHSGRSEDAREVLKFLEKKFPQGPVTTIGFSLGGNIVLKMLGEDESMSNCDSAVTVSAPFDLAKTTQKLQRRPNNIFQDYLLKDLVKQIEKKSQVFHELKKFVPCKFKTIEQLDEEFTAPLSGYRSADHYYSTCSSGGFLEANKTRTLIIASQDDPMIHTDFSLIPNRPHIESLITKKGGHVGFLGHDFHKRWSDEMILDWVAKL